MRALPLLWQAQVDDALSELEVAREARGLGWRQFARASAAHHALALLEKGQVDEAEGMLLEDVPLGGAQNLDESSTGDWGELGQAPAGASNNLEDAMRPYSLARVRLAQGRAKEALDAALATGSVVEGTVEFFGYCPWRATAAEAALALGDRQQAEELAWTVAARAVPDTGSHGTIAHPAGARTLPEPEGRARHSEGGRQARRRRSAAA